MLEAGITALSHGASVIHMSLLPEKNVPGDEELRIFPGDMITITTGLSANGAGIGPRK
jgi:hypothetical protein